MGPFWPVWPQARHRETTKDKSIEALRRLALRYRFFPADGILSPTRASTMMLSPTLQTSNRVFPFQLGIDTDLFSPADTLVSSKTTILYLANIQRRKGVFVLLEAFERIAGQFPEANLVFAGEGYQFEELKMRVSQSPFRTQIEVPGNVPRSDVPQTLRRCSVYCLPSLGEPYGMSALEAMSCGKPLIVTRAGGLGHLVPDEGSLKVTPNNVEELAAALVTLLEEDGLRKTMGLFNRSYVEQFHKWDRVMENLESIYHVLIERKTACNREVAALDRLNLI
jgi:glycosyltransferase involved in cell wall biosynthesis